MQIRLVSELGPSSDYRQDVFRLSQNAEGELVVSLVLKVPERLYGDNKPTSQKQRETLTTFFRGTDPLPQKSGWQQASRLMAMRGLAYAVAETMEEGFVAANRILLAPLIAAYISASPYLVCVARGWSLGTWREGSPTDGSDWLLLVASPFYRELLEFALLARDDFVRNAPEE